MTIRLGATLAGTGVHDARSVRSRSTGRSVHVEARPGRTARDVARGGRIDALFYEAASSDRHLDIIRLPDPSASSFDPTDLLAVVPLGRTCLVQEAAQ